MHGPRQAGPQLKATLDTPRNGMTVSDLKVIDFVSHDPKTNTVVLSMVEEREWGDSGQLLPDLQEKLNTYLAYALDGQLSDDYPEMRGKPVTIRLHHLHELGPREVEFIQILRRNHLDPAGILWEATRLGV